ncbi:hypothetical protein SKAU_G00331940 [Synaphobranchus kaupii]|uniref:Uncharacterized protein n=1 Tax=Synaphobranchus kaupii TaxID=118154 RepID=A0A9Q1IGD9_SYNKA|nr:hypothetical protein SKAU_G00331940 [Synaphobranchus kaupii]
METDVCISPGGGCDPSFVLSKVTLRQPSKFYRSNAAPATVAQRRYCGGRQLAGGEPAYQRVPWARVPRDKGPKNPSEAL